MVEMKFTKGKFSKISNIATVSLLLGFAFVSIFGMSLSMQMRSDGTMESCPLIGNAATLCNMSTSEHVGIWQNIFSVTSSGKAFAALMVLFATYLFYLLFDKLLRRSDSLALSLWFYRQEHPDSKLFNYLVAFFARGILQPKLYA